MCNMPPLLELMHLEAPPPAAQRGVLSTLVLQRPETQQEKGLRSSESAAQAMIGEAALALRLLRQQARPAPECALVADRAALAHLRRNGLHALWERRIALPDPSRTAAALLAPLPRHRRARPAEVPWLFKFAALLLTPFNETVYLDLDVLVLSPSFLADLFERSLRVADLAAPNDPAREAREYPTFHRLDDFGRGVPPPCASLLAYRLTPAVRRMFEAAAAGLLHRSVDLKARGFRNGDQELIWHLLWSGPPDAGLRLMQLPEEYYCPVRRGRTYMHQLGPSLDGPVLAPGTWPRWRTSWGKYRCKALHGHLGANDLRRANLTHLALGARAARFRWADHGES